MAGSRRGAYRDGVPTSLSADAFARARRFLTEHARPLERALFRFHFEDGPSDAVVDALHCFANPDGGFGHALEPDVRTPSSSALATALALRTLAAIEASADLPAVRRAVEWLVSTYDETSGTWRALPADANDHPHAPWWHDEADSLARNFDGFRVIPRALIVGLLHRFGRHLDRAWLDAVTAATVDWIGRLDVLGGGGGSDLEYVIELAQAPSLPAGYRERLESRIRRAIPDAVAREPAQWRTYCVTPLRAVPTPDAIGAELIASELASYLDFLIEEQADDGSWAPTWTFEYPAAWAQARTEWRGILTLGALRSLRAFGRIG